VTAENRFAVSEVPEPKPSRGQVLLHVKASTVCGTDQKIFAGQFPGTRFPHIPGHEFAGEVVELRDGVHALHPGERVGVEVLRRRCHRTVRHRWPRRRMAGALCSLAQPLAPLSRH